MATNKLQVLEKINPGILARKKIYAGIPDDDVALALAICQKYNLDPLLRHVVLIPAKVKDEKGNYVKRYTPYITRDGLLHVAHQSGQFDGMQVTLGRDELGEYAEATVYRKDMKYPFKYRVYMNEYKSEIGAWKTHPLSMLTKTAEVFALRRAFDVALTPVEEIGFEEHYETIPYEAVRDAKEAEQEPEQYEELATEAQRKKLYTLASKLGFSHNNMHAIMQERYGKQSSKELTKEEASDLIEYLSEIERQAEQSKQEEATEENVES